MENTKRICTECGNEMKFTKIERKFTMDGKEICIKGLNAYVCDKCGEIVFLSEEAKLIERILKVFKTDEETSILNLEETASILRVSNQTVYNMIKEGRIKAYKVGREWRFLKSDINSYLNSMSNIGSLAAKGGEIGNSDLEYIMKELHEEGENEKK